MLCSPLFSFALLCFAFRCFTGSITKHPHYQNNASTRQPHFRNNISYPQRNRDMIASVCRKQLEHQQHHLHPVQSTSILKDLVLFLFVPFSIDSSSDSPGPSLCITPSTTLSKQCLNPTTTLSKQRLHPPSTPSKQCYHKKTALSKQCLNTPTTFSKQCFFAGTVAGDAKHLGFT